MMAARIKKGDTVVLLAGKDKGKRGQVSKVLTNLDKVVVEWDERACLGVVMAADGYPEKYVIGEKIKLPSDSFNAKIFHAGTKLNNNNIYSNGGRVLCATALGKDIQQAQTKAYEFLEKVDWQGAYYRTDIGFKAL